MAASATLQKEIKWCCRLAERESQQTRAQQHQASCGQCKEAVGDKVVVAHDTPATAATADARPNLLKLS